ncbi:pentapeptide repeat-containing protein [Paenibacillus arenilitoris]|uniref:Pentapeptide repeat-containing protein n=1 Tax=Paenibacillus arenilitoris TaxID=2772299 RepID=A0A927H699_9BACL|nr:pentapeptide repeat-containing protein [Paenibacillus arenilitoris]MBD2869358.1 pentapeptide repeat-containing protein [Paenibacillus arenilitoris]
MSGNKVKIEPPKIPESLTEATVSDNEWADGQEISDVIFQESGVHNQSAYKLYLDRAVFRNVAFRGTSLRKAELTDVRFENCDLSNIDLTELVLHRAVFQNCKLLGMDLTGSTLRNVRFTQCSADYAVLRFANAKAVVFDNCSLAKADMSNMTLSQFFLKQSNIDGAQFSQTKLAGIDLSSCEFNGIGATLEDLRRSIISPGQASVFAANFGLIVKPGE